MDDLRRFVLELALQVATDGEDAQITLDRASKYAKFITGCESDHE